jgi:predicted RNA binding protein YcfA (HicA-like mRNA interferase family)
MDMPRKIRDLETDLRRAGFRRRAGKGSHRKWVHPLVPPVTVSGSEGADAKPY